MKYLQIILIALVAGGIGGYFTNQTTRNFGSLALPTATQEATTTGWADDGSVVRLDTATDIVGVGSTSPSQELGIAGSVFAQETSGTTTVNTSSTGTGVGSCIQLRGTGGTIVRLYATTVPATQANSGYKYDQGLVLEQGACQ